MEDEDTDYEVESEWIVKKKSFHVDRYGNACLYVGRAFRFLNEDNEWGMSSAKITSVVCKASERETLWFKFYDTSKHRTPPANYKLYGYAQCAQFMTTDSTKRRVQWEGAKTFTGEALVGRRVIRQFLEGPYVGTIKAFKVVKGKRQYQIVYSDGDSETTDEANVLRILRP